MEKSRIKWDLIAVLNYLASHYGEERGSLYLQEHNEGLQKVMIKCHSNGVSEDGLTLEQVAQGGCFISTLSTQNCTRRDHGAT